MPKTNSVKDLASALTAPVETTASAKEEAVEPKFHTIVIFRFYRHKETGNLIVQFTENGAEHSAIAHPALKVKPLMGKELTAKIEECRPKWKLRSPVPTKEEREAYASRNTVKVAQKAELTEDEKEASKEF